MVPDRRRVTRLPLQQLWRGADQFEAGERGLGLGEIAALLRVQSVEFVIADVGKPLCWVEPAVCFEFWKSEVKPRLATAARTYLSAFPGERGYVACEWHSKTGTYPVIVLECLH